MSKLFCTYIDKVLRVLERTSKGGELAEKRLLVEEETKEHLVGYEIPKNVANSKDAQILKKNIVYTASDKKIDLIIEEIIEKKRSYCNKSQPVVAHTLDRLRAAKSRTMAQEQKKSKLAIGKVDASVMAAPDDELLV